MAPPDSKSKPPPSSLDVLQLMLDDMLIQTGKAVIATSKNASANIPQTPGGAQFKLPEIIRTFHTALDEVESEIIKAKSVIQRDLSLVQASRTHSQRPEPVNAQSKSPVILDLDSSPPPVKEEPVAVSSLDARSVAPFPDMGMNLSAANSKKEESSTPAPVAVAVMSQPFAPKSAPAAPLPAMEQPGFVQQPGIPSASVIPTTEAPVPEMSFNQIQFAPAPGGNEQSSGPGKNQPLNLDTVGPKDGTNHGIPLNNSVPVNTNNPSASNSLGHQGTESGPPGQPMFNTGNNGTNSMPGESMNSAMYTTFDDGGNGDDFDFTMDDGNSFDALMTSHEGSFNNPMEHGQDNDFFGLNK